MNDILKNELLELCILSIIKKRPMVGYELILELDKFIGLENITYDTCFFEVRRQGYLKYISGEWKGKKCSLYCITQKGLDRLNDFNMLWARVTEIRDELSKIK